jgi:hypothetical protein
MFTLLLKGPVQIQNTKGWKNALGAVEERLTASPGRNMNHINGDYSADRRRHDLGLYGPWLF